MARNQNPNTVGTETLTPTERQQLRRYLDGAGYREGCRRLKVARSTAKDAILGAGLRPCTATHLRVALAAQSTQSTESGPQP
jgi:hypothetical protein